MPSEKQIMRLKKCPSTAFENHQKCLFRLDFAATIVPNLFHLGIIVKWWIFQQVGAQFAPLE